MNNKQVSIFDVIDKNEIEKYLHAYSNKSMTIENIIITSFMNGYSKGIDVYKKLGSHTITRNFDIEKNLINSLEK